LMTNTGPWAAESLVWAQEIFTQAPFAPLLLSHDQCTLLFEYLHTVADSYRA
jgi:hypothetical protein